MNLLQDFFHMTKTAGRDTDYRKDGEIVGGVHEGRTGDGVGADTDAAQHQADAVQNTDGTPGE